MTHDDGLLRIECDYCSEDIIEGIAHDCDVIGTWITITRTEKKDEPVKDWEEPPLPGIEQP